MKNVILDKKPKQLEMDNNGLTCRYYTNIQKVEISDDTLVTDGEASASTVVKYQADCYVIPLPLFSDKIKRIVINELWDKDKQQKLSNEYIAAKNGLIADKEEKAAAISAFEAFITDRKTILGQVDKDCSTLEIL